MISARLVERIIDDVERGITNIREKDSTGKVGIDPLVRESMSLDCDLEYFPNPFYYAYDVRESTREHENRLSLLFCYDLMAMFEERDGVFQPKEGLKLMLDEDRGIEISRKPEKDGDVRPYVWIVTHYKRLAKLMVDAIADRCYAGFRDKSFYRFPVRNNTLFHAEGLDALALSLDIHPGLAGKENEIYRLYSQLIRVPLQDFRIIGPKR